MLTVLLRPPRLDPVRRDAELDPPHREPGEPADRLRRERRPVVDADGPRQPVLSEEAVEGPERAVLLHGLMPVAAEDEPGVRVADGKGEAVGAVAGLELPFVIGRPDVAGRVGHV